MRALTGRLLCAGLLMACGTPEPGAPDADPDTAGLAEVAEVEPVQDPLAELPSTLSGGFEDLTSGLQPWPPFDVDPGAPAEGREPETTHGIFADLDGDGTMAVILSGAVREEVDHQTYRLDPDTGALTPRPIDTLPQGAILMAEDLDGDGHTDALMSTGVGLVIYWSDGAGVFSEWSLLAPEVPIAYEQATVHPVDLDADGWVDLLARTNCGMVALFRTGLRTWTYRPDTLQGIDSVDPYAIVTWPRADRPTPLIAMGYADCGLYGTYESTELDAEGYPSFEPVQMYEGQLMGDASMGPNGLESMSPMGAASADLDRDGLFDLFVTVDPGHLILDGADTWPVTDSHKESGLFLVGSDTEHAQVGWGVALVDLNKDGLDDVLVAHGDDTSRFMGTDPSPGPQWATLHLNGGDFRFVDVTEQVGLGRRGQWRALSIGDLDGDADADLIVGGLGEPPRVWRNDLEATNQGLAIRLLGTASNALGVGAQVIVNPSGASVERRYAVGAMGSPKAVSSPMVFAGLGEADEADVTVVWPSGVVQRLEGLAAGETHRVTEPALLTVSPQGRHVSVGGDEVVTVTVRPESPASSVTVTVTHGDGAPGDAVLADDGAWRVTVAPPPEAGFARLEVRIDGQPVGIRPHLWWDGP